MRIVEIIPQLSSGGAERFVVDLCNQLEKKGNEVVLIVFSKLGKGDGNDFYLSELSKNVRIIEIEKKSGIDFQLFNKLRGLLKIINPDVVHSHLRSLPYLLLSFLFNRKIKYYHTIHNDAKVEASDSFNRISRKVAFKTGRCYPITISKESDQSFIDFYGKNVEHSLIENGSPNKPFNVDGAPEVIKAKEEGKTVLVNVARHNPQKNLMALVEAANEIPDIDLFLVGNNQTEYGTEVKNIAGENVHILGQRSNPRDYMAAADAFILPSNFEGMPITLIECFSVGGFPIVTPVGGMKNMVKDHINGLVVPSEKKQDIKNTILDFLKISKKEQKDIRQKSFETFDRYGIEECTHNYLKLFTE